MARLAARDERYNALVQRLGGRARPAAAPSRALRLQVTAREHVADDVVALRLEGDGPLPRWQPGAHVALRLPSGRRRTYSLCGDPLDRAGYRVAVRRLGGGSAELHALRVGTELLVRAPRNGFPFAGEPEVCFVAGGIGLTALLPMVVDAHRLGLRWQLVHVGRSRGSMPFTAELPPGDVELRVGRAGPPLLAHVSPQAAVYLCGPASMLDDVRGQLGGRSLHHERFVPPPVVGGRPFVLELGRSGRRLAVPADRSALDVLLDARPDYPVGCRQGYCGTCTVDGVRVCVERPDGGLLRLGSL
ncbi:PDR/VanB family oxidoreductase [Angustibacter aerolatus]